jgi:hypothetical protein
VTQLWLKDSRYFLTPTYRVSGLDGFFYPSEILPALWPLQQQQQQSGETEKRPRGGGEKEEEEEEEEEEKEEGEKNDAHAEQGPRRSQRVRLRN